MEKQLQGRAFVFGKNIDTDQIYPGRFVELTNVEDVAKHAMEGADPNFVKQFKKGDIIVASTNFGCGSSREHAAITLKAVGVGAIVAESFGRIFYRNAINLGVPVLVCPGISTAVTPGDELTIDIQSGTIVNETKGSVIQAQPISEYIMNILASSGIKAMIKNQLQQL
ncbi:3-isopropylmalate dehydratase small subunit [Robertmurraya massiliosenegalensis]|uniref:3-isopropylmalate dehydratase small subunit n=1 Tax=Robertmurraya massiliosenegalensis TaxID=1287657 RepID=UPI0002F0CACF|nr:3-isopropylmalate dehydratase small subunit [Robertmurraya massiliosenegalensis]